MMTTHHLHHLRAGGDVGPAPDMYMWPQYEFRPVLKTTLSRNIMDDTPFACGHCE
jgi:hypothetical protein